MLKKSIRVLWFSFLFSPALEAQVIFNTSFGVSKIQDVNFVKSVKNEDVNDYLAPRSFLFSSPILFSVHQGIFFEETPYTDLSLRFGVDLSFRGLASLKPERQGSTSLIRGYHSLTLMPEVVAAYSVHPKWSLLLGGGFGAFLGFLGPLAIELETVDGARETLNLLEANIQVSYCFETFLGAGFHLTETLAFQMKAFLYYEKEISFGENQYSEHVLQMSEEGKIKDLDVVPVSDRIDTRLDDFTEVQNFLSFGLQLGLSYRI